MSSNIPIIFKWYLNRQGIQGAQGVQGEEGFSPTITVYEDTLTKYTLKVQDKYGYFITPNLRQVTQDSGGTYVRYDRSTGQMFAGFADGATDTQVGVVRLATPQEVIDGVDTAVITPADLVDYLTNTYQLPIATTGQLGGVKVGSGINVGADGTISVIPYSLPTASTTVLGGVKVDGTTITVDPDGTIHGASTYSLPQATNTTLGGVKVETKTDDDTQPVRIDTATGLLYTAAGGIPNVLDGGNASSVSATAVINNISQQVDINDYPQMNTVEETISITTPEPEETT